MRYVTPSECYVHTFQACTVDSGYTAARIIESSDAAYQNGSTSGLQSVMSLLSVRTVASSWFRRSKNWKNLLSRSQRFYVTSSRCYVTPLQG